MRPQGANPIEVQVRDLTIHYEEAGSGTPLLIVHGIAGNARIFMPYTEPVFAAHPGWRRIYPDLPGHGKTPMSASVRSNDDVLDVLLEFMNAVAPGERFALAGFSWGGYIAQGIVHHRLSRIDGVMLGIPAADWGSATPDYPAHQVVRRHPQFDTLQPEEELLLGAIVAQSSAVGDSVRTNMIAHWTDTDLAVFERLMTPFSFNPDQLPEPCPAPALIITGRQDSIVGYKAAWSILDNFPRGTFAVLDSAGHLLYAEQPALFQALMGEWLDRVEEYRTGHTLSQ